MRRLLRLTLLFALIAPLGCGTDTTPPPTAEEAARLQKEAREKVKSEERNKK
jgi:hypothetical protein